MQASQQKFVKRISTFSNTEKAKELLLPLVEQFQPTAEEQASPYML